MNLTPYIVELQLQQQPKASFEDFWTMLMDANVDCVTDLDYVQSLSDTQYGIHSIFFKTTHERELVKTMINIVK